LTLAMNLVVFEKKVRVDSWPYMCCWKCGPN